jgi:hypothetical protein
MVPYPVFADIEPCGHVISRKELIDRLLLNPHLQNRHNFSPQSSIDLLSKRWNSQAWES